MQKWLGFWMLGFIWGSSYLLIHFGVKELSPFQLVFMRTTIAAVGMNITLLLWHKRLPTARRDLLPLLLIGLGNTTVPFALTSWGGKSVATGLASVLQSTEALFTLLIAHFFLKDEQITFEKATGLGVGFIGVIVLTSDPQQMQGDFASIIAVMTAALFYSIFVVYSRRIINQGADPFVISTGSMTAAAITSGAGMLVTPMLGGQSATPLAQVEVEALVAVAFLGIINTYIAYMMSYWVLQQLGATRFSMLTYVVLMVGLLLGVLVLHEPITWRLGAGTALVLAGTGVASLASQHQKQPSLCPNCETACQCRVSVAACTPALCSI